MKSEEEARELLFIYLTRAMADEGGRQAEQVDGTIATVARYDGRLV